jgi:hypothetical protein
MRRTLKPNLLTGRKLPPRLNRMFKFANREFDLFGRKDVKVIRSLMVYVPRPSVGHLRAR